MNTASKAGNFEIGKILRLPAFFVCKKKKGEDVEHRKTYRLGIAAGSPALDGLNDQCMIATKSVHDSHVIRA